MSQKWYNLEIKYYPRGIKSPVRYKWCHFFIDTKALVTPESRPTPALSRSGKMDGRMLSGVQRGLVTFWSGFVGDTA